MPADTTLPKLALQPAVLKLHLLDRTNGFFTHYKKDYEWLKTKNKINIPRPTIDFGAFSLAEYQSPFQSQGARGSCYAFASVAAMEAFYKRRYGLNLKLSEQYAFHINKCTELISPDLTEGGLVRENNTSLWGFQGNSTIVGKFEYCALPEARHCPYQDQPALDTLKTSLVGAGSFRTQEEMDTVEYSERHIPLAARHEAKYRVTGWQAIPDNPSVAVIESTIRSGFEIIADIPGHCLLIVGYDRNRRVFIAKNSWGENRFIELPYADTESTAASAPAWKIIGGCYITSVSNPNDPPQNHARWLGTWNMDHDGWKGKLVIRRHCNFRNVGNVTAPTRLGNYYRDGKRYDVNGYFEDNGRKMVFFINNAEGRIAPGTLQGQRSDVYTFSFDPVNAAGKTTWNGTGFGCLLSRASTPGRFSNSFARTEWLGNWNMNHDGWRGRLNLTNFVDSSFLFFHSTKVVGNYTSQDGRVLPVEGELFRGTPHIIRINIRFDATNNQTFDLTYHTWEDGVFSGLTYWGGSTFGVIGSR